MLWPVNAPKVSHFNGISASFARQYAHHKPRIIQNGVPDMTIDLTETEFNARDAHIISMIRDLEAARASAKA